MKTALMALMGLILVNSLCFAETKGMIHTHKMNPAVTMHTATGTVESINAGDPAKSIKPELTLKEDNGSGLRFNLSKVSVTDANSKPMTLDQIMVGSKIKVQFVTNSAGVHQAKLITLT